MARLAGAQRIATAWVLLSWLSLAHVSAQEAEHGEVELMTEASSEHSGHKPREHRPLALGFDLVIGFGAYPLLLPTRGGLDAEVFGSVGDVGVQSESILIAASYEVAEHVGVGARLPLTFGSVPATDGSTKGTFALGNVELEGETEIELSETAALVFSLGFALPTAQGSEEPELAENSEGSTSDYDRFVLNRIAASSRGFEDNALFEVDRLGIIPKVALNCRNDHVLFDPFVKLENLIATNDALERSYIAELVFGMFFGYALSENFDLGARVWGSAAFFDEIEEVGVVEPQLRAHFMPVDLVLGGIIPLAGELTDPQFGGVRLAGVLRL
jgi:hypothetical protein